MSDQYTVDTSAMLAEFRSIYWSQIFNRKLSWRVKWIAIRSLWIMRKWGGGAIMSDTNKKLAEAIISHFGLRKLAPVPVQAGNSLDAWDETWASVRDPLMEVISQELRAEPATPAEQELTAALKTARSLIVAHHNCGKRVEWGQPCPHCVHEDGSEPEMNQIAEALAKAGAA